MNLYLITRNVKSDFDQVRGAVVRARYEETAKTMPLIFDRIPDEDIPENQRVVELIGTAKTQLEGVVLVDLIES
jgi:hypothetical protein